MARSMALLTAWQRFIFLVESVKCDTKLSNSHQTNFHQHILNKLSQTIFLYVQNRHTMHDKQHSLSVNTLCKYCNKITSFEPSSPIQQMLFESCPSESPSTSSLQNVLCTSERSKGEGKEEEHRFFFSRFWQSFTSNFPFSFPFPSPIDLSLALKTHSSHLSHLQNVLILLQKKEMRVPNFFTAKFPKRQLALHVW